MMAVDTSALIAILQDEPEAAACMHALATDPDILISAATVAEALIVSERRNIGEEMDSLLQGLDLQVVPVTAASARRVATVYSLWGKGVHTAALNLGDCFAYEVARTHACPLLFVGDDFSKTDVEGAL